MLDIARIGVCMIMATIIALEPSPLSLMHFGISHAINLPRPLPALFASSNVDEKSSL